MILPFGRFFLTCRQNMERMDNNYFNMELKQFKNLFQEKNALGLDDDFCIIDVKYGDGSSSFQMPVRLDAYLMIFCISGRTRLSINMKEFTMEKDQVALLIPGYIGQVLDEGPHHAGNHYVILGMSRRYLSTLHLDLNRFFTEGTTLMNSPCVQLTPEEKAIAARYSELTSVILQSDVSNKRECVSSLISSLFYMSEGIFSRQANDLSMPVSVRSSRSDLIFNKFLRLLADYHTKERNVSFYADKLCLSPKYFSKLVKEATGRTAPEWIDTYVIMEAKNYLKYSELSIKQIVYKLHFTDQPTFTKYFKNHTGMTPAQFRKQ